MIGAGPGRYVTRVPALPPFDQPLARQFGERAPHRDPRYAVILCQVVFGRKFDAEAQRTAENAVAKHHVDLLRLCLAEPIAQVSLRAATPAGGRFTWYSLAYNICGSADKRGNDAADPAPA